MISNVPTNAMAWIALVRNGSWGDVQYGMSHIASSIVVAA
eukprot:CAMPEP_0204638462 /NCGR_PEP_ID=MMETSP0717-20131115/39584_1 /ASSEMBLY_ACC=CAM_ASM_000666 /TAXON_ID=230516 /ORGANISM="Chaetoceros curvisetus" /LENGTH=39 /DNA_ID= /DNA_START= /DNA_END= /DNA_ORIENTATION=